MLKTDVVGILLLFFVCQKLLEYKTLLLLLMIFIRHLEIKNNCSQKIFKRFMHFDWLCSSAVAGSRNEFYSQALTNDQNFGRWQTTTLQNIFKCACSSLVAVLWRFSFTTKDFTFDANVIPNQVRSQTGESCMVQ